MTREKKKFVGVGITFLTAIFGGINMVDRGAIRPGWLMITAGGIGVSIALWKLFRKPPSSQKEESS